MEFIRIELGRLLDGRGLAGVHNAAVLIGDDRILEAGSAASVSRPDSAHEIAFPSATALPGFIDCHAHLTMPGDGIPVEAMAGEDECVSTSRAAENARRCLENGVTTFVDCGAPGRSTFALKEAIAQGSQQGPRLIICGRPLTQTGGHGWPMGGEANGALAMRRAVRNLVREGADFIKVMVSGGSTRTTSRFQTYLGDEEITAVVEEAHAGGRPVVAHATSVSAIARCLDAGVDVLAHATFYKPGSNNGTGPAHGEPNDDFGQFAFDPSLAGRIAHQAIPVVPTLWTNRVRMARLERVAAERPLSEAEARDRDQRRRTYEERLENLTGLASAGVLLGAGSDCGWGPPFGTFHEEIRALSDAGLGPAGAILAATRNAARIMGIEATVGTLEPGKLADMVLVDGDPMGDLMALRSVTAVFLGGRQVV